MRGRFVTLEGGEGAGKSTQLKRLAAELRGRGLEVIETREPGGSPGAETIRQLLLQGDEDKWTAGAEALLFAAARGDHVAKTVKPALARGAWVLCDRFLDSSLAYQGCAGGLGLEAIRALHSVGSEGFMPDRTLLLRLPSEEAALRARQRDGDSSDRIGGRDPAYHQKVTTAFDHLAGEDPRRFRTIDADAGPDEVTSRLLKALEDLL